MRWLYFIFGCFAFSVVLVYIVALCLFVLLVDLRLVGACLVALNGIVCLSCFVEC